MNGRVLRLGGLAVWVGAGMLSVGMLGTLSGCEQRALFVDSDPATHKVRYYRDQESAVETSARRKQAMEMGFGYSQGAAPQ